jgi:hypothetical protein
MGSLVTKSIPDFHLAMGHPAKSVGCVCRCGQLLKRFTIDENFDEPEITCSACGLKYTIASGEVIELTPPISN